MMSASIFGRAEMPYRLPIRPNQRLHPMALARQNRQQRTIGHHLLLAAAGGKGVLRFRKALPLVIDLVRVGPRRADDDNIDAAFKSIRDGIAEALEVDDGSDAITWQTHQITRSGQPPAQRYLVQIVIRPRTAQDDEALAARAKGIL